MPRLGVNIDHVATLRQARRGARPDPLAAARICEQAGADGIVCHLREDRRHIQDQDVRELRKIVRTHLNLELSLDRKILKIAAQIKPDMATIVPERRQEITTEGGLDVCRHFLRIKEAVKFLEGRGIVVSLFIAADKRQIEKSRESGAGIIELHTGSYAHAATTAARRRELQRLKDMTRLAQSLGLRVSAGHGLDYTNVKAVARLKGMEELNIGHAIIARAVFTGLDRAVGDMLKLTR